MWLKPRALNEISTEISNLKLAHMKMKIDMKAVADVLFVRHVRTIQP